MSLQDVGQAGRWDTVLQQGSTFVRTLEFSVDIDAMNFRGQIRRTHRDPNVLAEFTFEHLDERTLSLRLDAEATAALPAERLVFDIEAYPEGETYVTRVIEGQLRVSPEVTR